MRIVLLCRNLHTAGGYVVGINFVRCLKKVAPSHQFLVVIPPGVGYEDIELPEGSEFYPYTGGQSTFNQWRFDCFELPRVIRKFKPDIVFGMGNVGLTIPRIRQAILFHKPHMVYESKHYASERMIGKIRNWMLKRRLQVCLKYTDIVFCQTPVARERFTRFFDFPLDRIRLMPNAVSEFAKIEEAKVGVPKVLREKSFFNLFCLTKYYAHKNLEVLVDVFRRHGARLSDVRCLVTVSGNQHPNAPAFLDSIRRNKLDRQLVNVGPLRQTELAGYYYHSDAYILPTLLESFSGSYLEAMHFQRPILTSDLDFARYVCGEAAVYFNPWDPDDIAEKILLIKNNATLREELVRKGTERISTFFRSWEQITSETISELEQAAI